jgi:hypothetical protein
MCRLLRCGQTLPVGVRRRELPSRAGVSSRRSPGPRTTRLRSKAANLQSRPCTGLRHPRPIQGSAATDFLKPAQPRTPRKINLHPACRPACACASYPQRPGPLPAQPYSPLLRITHGTDHGPNVWHSRPRLCAVDAVCRAPSRGRLGHMNNPRYRRCPTVRSRPAGRVGRRAVVRAWLVLPGEWCRHKTPAHPSSGQQTARFYGRDLR